MYTLFRINISLLIYILVKLWSSCLIVCLLEAVRTNPGYGMATLISGISGIIFRLCKLCTSAKFLYIQDRL